MIDHSRFQEILALRLYGEAGAEELRTLDSHLQDCARCRSFAEELSAGIGVLAAGGDGAEPLPPRWAEELHHRTMLRPGILRRSGMVAAAAFAAGVLVTVLVIPHRAPGAPSPHPPRAPAAEALAPAPAFARATPPEPAHTRGFVALAGTLLARSGGG